MITSNLINVIKIGGRFCVRWGASSTRSSFLFHYLFLLIAPVRGIAFETSFVVGTRHERDRSGRTFLPSDITGLGRIVIGAFIQQTARSRLEYYDLPGKYYSISFPLLPVAFQRNILYRSKAFELDCNEITVVASMEYKITNRGVFNIECILIYTSLLMQS